MCRYASKGKAPATDFSAVMEEICHWAVGQCLRAARHRKIWICKVGKIAVPLEALEPSFHQLPTCASSFRKANAEKSAKWLRMLRSDMPWTKLDRVRTRYWQNSNDLANPLQPQLPFRAGSNARKNRHQSTQLGTAWHVSCHKTND